jgi:hypothetical protein
MDKELASAAAKKGNTLLQAPCEVVVHILSFLEPYDLCTVSQVCVVRTVPQSYLVFQYSVVDLLLVAVVYMLASAETGRAQRRGRSVAPLLPA